MGEVNEVFQKWGLPAGLSPPFKPCAFFPSSHSDIVVLTKDCSYTELSTKGQVAFLKLNHRMWYEFWKPRLVGIVIYGAESTCRKYAGNLSQIIGNILTSELTFREKIFLEKVSRLGLKVEE
jgi:hypothetical protein